MGNAYRILPNVMQSFDVRGGVVGRGTALGAGRSGWSHWNFALT